jgi:hypothetical protein
VKSALASATLILNFLLLMECYASSQSTTPRPSRQPIRLSTDLALVDAQVVNKKTGIPVHGLARDDFALYEDGAKQTITHFSLDPTPLSVILLLDVARQGPPVAQALFLEQVRQGSL